MSNAVCLISPDDPSREGLSHVLHAEGFDVIGSFRSVAEVSVKVLGADVLAILDWQGVGEQSKAIAELQSMHSSIRIVVLSDDFDLIAMMSCFRQGAEGYIVKSEKSWPMIAALRQVVSAATSSPSLSDSPLEKRMRV
jgi:two-component system nitrate/nitrite response regulator NarL